MSDALTPRQIVAELDKYIVGQKQAKRSVAIALRNRYRRSRLPEALRDEVTPKNILMIGPTGVGKTEIARRLAKLVNAPFEKVEATKFTEVGYVGRDVESMVRDLVETAIRMVKEERQERGRPKAEQAANDRLAALLVPSPSRSRPQRNPLEMLFGAQQPTAEEPEPGDSALSERRREGRRKLETGELEREMVEIEVEETATPLLDMFSIPGQDQLGHNMQELFGHLIPKRRKKRRLTVSEARKALIQEEAAKLIDMDDVIGESLRRAEQSGIIFIDEIDKIASSGRGHGPDVSREGVQRDILPIVEGCTVMTKYGPIKTDHILFIAAGAFHMSKPSDLIPELQGRFPIRVELSSLTDEDFIRILKEPENALTKQYAALLSTEGIRIRFTDAAIAEIAAMAQEVNRSTEDIGARRLHTLLEKLLEDVSFEAPDLHLEELEITAEYVREKLSGVVGNRDLSQYIL